MAEFRDLSNSEELVIYCQECVKEVNASVGSGGDCTDAVFLNYLKKHFLKSKREAIKVDSTNQESSASGEVKSVTCDACQQPCSKSGRGVATVFDEEYTGKLQSSG